MSFQRLLPLFLLLFPAILMGQNKSYAFSSFQTRDQHQQWGNTQYVGSQQAQFTATQINVKADKDYRLQIISKTDLPEKGVIYLCKDDKSNAVTVMLIENVKMYLYNKASRFLINFDTFATQAYMADTD